jgi:tetratricopeptide (TPR) repeat protein
VIPTTIIGLLGTAVALLTRCANQHSTISVATNLSTPVPPKESSSPTPSQRPGLAQEEAAAIERGLLALDSHGVLRLIDLRNGLASKDAKTYNYLAWHWATCPKKEHVDAVRALKFAQRAVELKPNDNNFTDTLAAAYARNGKFAEAIAAQQKAMDIVADQMKQAGIIEPAELPPDESALAWMDDSERQQYRKLEEAWNEYRERAEPYLWRRKELQTRLEVYRKGLALISPKDYPTSSPDQK